MDREKLQTFIKAAEAGLASVRSSLLIVAQTGDASDLGRAGGTLARLKADAADSGQHPVAELTAQCESSLMQLAQSEASSPPEVYAVLDHVARIEAALFEIPQYADQLLEDISDLIDTSFEGLVLSAHAGGGEAQAEEEFEIDDETLDIFRTEADELLANICDGLRTLSISPDDQNALWEIRRNAHTFKGAAGIVGLKNASEIAHKMEDLLDKMVEMRREAVPQVVDFLAASADKLDAIVSAKEAGDGVDLESSYAAAMAWLSSPAASESEIADAQTVSDAGANRYDIVKTTTTPIVRVSLDRLDELIKLSRSLIFNRSAIAERFNELGASGVDDKTHARLESLIETHRHLADEIHVKLQQIRMVRFGTLETRLSRVVNATCQDEGKRAVVEIENGEVEIDTQLIDALIEPLLHLLKNAVVHGIEPPDTRRLIGKSERGVIRIRIEADNEALVLSVADDGSGISAARLKEKALASGIIDADTAAKMSDREAMKLIFDRGLTTADKIDLNAGRGVGMSIVKESVENRGGSVLVESEPQHGTTFTILMPLNKSEPPASAGGQFAGSKAPARLEDKLSNCPPTHTGRSDKTPLVLVVDDSAVIRHQTTKFVEAAGLRVITANNGAEALELLLNGEWEPGLILSDVEMPQIDGWEFLEYVKTDDNLGHIPMVMVTSLASDEHRQRAFGLGASDYLVKPFSGDDLDRILEKFCGAVTA